MTAPRNIIMLMTDQQRADCRAAEGFALDTMPSLDRFAASGADFRRAYTTSPVCTPARCSLLSGRFPKATGVRALGAASEIRMSCDIFQHLAAHGFETALIGKNHSHVDPATIDHCRDYSHWRGEIREGLEERDADFNHWLSQHPICSLKPTPFPVDSQLPVRIIDDAVDWLASPSRTEKPFCLWISIPEPHEPYQVPEPYFSLFPEAEHPKLPGAEALADKGPVYQFNRDLDQRHHPEHDAQAPRYRSNYYGMLRLIDDQLARLFDHLQASGLEDDTVIVCTSDHGDYTGQYGLWKKGAGLPECLVRVPMIWRGPGIASSLPEAHVSLVDIFPTLCEAVELPIPPGVQGRSLWPLLQGETVPEAEFASVYAENGVGGVPFLPEEVDWDAWPQHLGDPKKRSFASELNAVSQGGHRKMVRRGRWKLVYDPHHGGELYDLEIDPFELNNRYEAPANATIRQAMLELLLRWNIRTEDTLPVGRWPLKRQPHGWDGL